MLLTTEWKNKLFAVLAAAFIFCSCSSTPAPREEPFTVDLRSPRYELGTAEIYFKNALSMNDNLKRAEIKVYYYPFDDAVCLQFKTIQYVDCRQFWNKSGRDAFVSAFECYREEYEQHMLTVSKSKTMREMYGTVQGYYTWQRTRLTVRALGSPKISLGYQFSGNTAFFCTTQSEARYKDPITSNRNQTSPVTMMYFTRAQAESLVALFDQEFLRNLSGNREEELDVYF